MTKSVLVMVFVCAVSPAWFILHANQSTAVDQDFRSFLSTWEEAQTRFINGDPSLWKQHTSKQDDVTIVGGFGGEGEKGWKAVGARYDWASSQYRSDGATLKVDYLNIAVSGDLAFTIGIERQQGVRVGAGKTPVRRALRATQIFRKERDGWKLLHRHADQMTEKQEPSGVAPRR
jgi:ketosteroid isomerase-like protein